MTETIPDRFQRYLSENWPAESSLKDLAVMGMGMTGETGEAQEHFKKVIRDHNLDFDNYPDREAALLEFGDALHYLLKCAAKFGWSLEALMYANMEKLDKRYKRGAYAPKSLDYNAQCGITGEH
jgi:NTP pyrophosphatase (non-canonical NTP hydrolase)